MVSLVGAGPGDPGLLTIKGKEILARADVIIYDALANAQLLEYARPDAELIYVGKIADQHALPQAEINALLVEKARDGKLVARLKGGDPYIFGRGGEEGEYLASHGIPFEEVPGISSSIAAPAYAGIPLTHRDFVSAVTLITGHERPDKENSAHDWAAYVKSGATLVFLMGMKNLPGIVKNLLDAGMSPQMPAAVIYRGATPMQKVATAPLVGIEKEAEGLSNPAIIVVGKVVTLRDKLDWYSQKPLLGRTVVVTRAREQASDIAKALAELGAQVLECPGIEIQPLADYSACDAAIQHLGQYAWLVFTSVNGVKYFWQRLVQAGLDSRAIGKAKIAVIGPATAQALTQKGINADLMPETYVAEGIIKAMREKAGDLKGQRILLPRAEKARNVLPEELAKCGAQVDVVPMYRAMPARTRVDEVRNALAAGRLDCISFGSSSTVENFLDLISAEHLRKSRTTLAAIGPITAQTLRKYGLDADIQPRKYTIPALVAEIASYFSTMECAQ